MSRCSRQTYNGSNSSGHNNGWRIGGGSLSSNGENEISLICNWLSVSIIANDDDGIVTRY